MGLADGGAGEGLGPFPYPGDGHSIAAAAYDPADPFETRVASIYRFAVDTGRPGHALSGLAPGQSEHPSHPHRTSGLERWLERRPSLLVTSPLLVEESTDSRLVLEPAP
jgi:acyl-homoserine lactone acylase PvdQ